jgi:hypothetical protein
MNPMLKLTSVMYITWIQEALKQKQMLQNIIDVGVT